MQNLRLAQGKIPFRRQRAGFFVKGLHHPAGNLAAHGGSALFCILNGLHDLQWVCAFEQITAGARFKGVEDMLAIFINGQHQNLEGRA